MTRAYKIIAETAFTHEGNKKYLFKQIEEAGKGACDYIKFQILLDPENYFAEKAEGHDKIRELMLAESHWSQAIQYAADTGLKTIVLPLTVESARFCQTFGNKIDAMELHSVCFNEQLLIEEIQAAGKEVVLGIGGRYPFEINNAVQQLGADKNIILMHGIQSFPTDETRINLNKIKTLKEIYKHETGYADHTHYQKTFSHLLCYAYLLGARYFEKHIILQKGEDRLDSQSAVSRRDFIDMRSELDHFIEVLGENNIFSLNEKEYDYRNREKQLVAKKDIPKGDVIKESDLTYKVTSEKSDFEQYELKKIIGKCATMHIDKDTPLKYIHIN
ncbi:MAG: N-acetylneuraminate synthase family protein [Desulfobacteraceae bacterium]|nr:N-acetylneuraminate synthase family protein [Desulfobacteraceae bacterium]